MNVPSHRTEFRNSLAVTSEIAQISPLFSLLTGWISWALISFVHRNALLTSRLNTALETLNSSFILTILFFTWYDFSAYLVLTNVVDSFIPYFQVTIFCSCTHCVGTHILPDCLRWNCLKNIFFLLCILAGSERSSWMISHLWKPWKWLCPSANTLQMLLNISEILFQKGFRARSKRIWCFSALTFPSFVLDDNNIKDKRMWSRTFNLLGSNVFRCFLGGCSHRDGKEATKKWHILQLASSRKKWELPMRAGKIL